MKERKLKIFFIGITILSFLSCSIAVSGTPSNQQDKLNIDLHVTKSDYTKENLTQILYSETEAEMTKRGFYTDKPIQAEIENGKLKVTSYAPVTIKNTIIFRRNKNSDNNFEPLAFYDEIYGFSQSLFNLPKNLDITNENTELKVTAEGDPYMSKINTIKNPLHITFAQGNGGPWNAMSPTAARKASIVGTTMSYMFNHKDYKEHLKQWNEGGYKEQEVVYAPIPIPGAPVFVWLPSAPFKDDNGNPLSYETVYSQAINKGGINFSLIKDTEPAGGIGGGNILGFREYLFDNFLKYNTLPYNGNNQKDLKCYTVDVMFHELAHCMGYYHPDNPKDYKGTMTYGGGWTTANYVFLNKLVDANDLPVPLDGKWAENTGFPNFL